MLSKLHEDEIAWWLPGCIFLWECVTTRMDYKTFVSPHPPRDHAAVLPRAKLGNAHPEYVESPALFFRETN